jgi:hypothetical protein
MPLFDKLRAGYKRLSYKEAAKELIRNAINFCPGCESAEDCSRQMKFCSLVLYDTAEYLDKNNPV